MMEKNEGKPQKQLMKALAQKLYSQISLLISIRKPPIHNCKPLKYKQTLKKYILGLCEENWYNNGMMVMGVTKTLSNWLRGLLHQKVFMHGTLNLFETHYWGDPKVQGGPTVGMFHSHIIKLPSKYVYKHRWCCSQVWSEKPLFTEASFCSGLMQRFRVECNQL